MEKGNSHARSQQEGKKYEYVIETDEVNIGTVGAVKVLYSLQKCHL